jgi:hypothetical protein
MDIIAVIVYLSGTVFTARYAFIHTKPRVIKASSERQWEENAGLYGFLAILLSLVWTIGLPLYIAMTYPSREDREKIKRENAEKLSAERERARQHALQTQLDEIKAINAQLNALGVDAGQPKPEPSIYPPQTEMVNGWIVTRQSLESEDPDPSYNARQRNYNKRRRG